MVCSTTATTTGIAGTAADLQIYGVITVSLHVPWLGWPSGSPGDAIVVRNHDSLHSVADS